MKKFSMAVPLCALILALPISAQTEKEDRKKMHAEREAVELILLRQKSVREELKIDKEVAKKIYEFTHKQHEKAMEVHQLPRDEQTAKWEAMEKENNEFLHSAIKPEQRKRLHQIAMQTTSLLFVTAPKIAKELSLTDEQQSEAKKMLHETQEKVFAIIKAESKAGRNEKLKEIREASHEKLEKLLTEDQKKKWKELTGEPFKGHLVYEEKEEDKKVEKE